jgi:hypothetical protein
VNSRAQAVGVLVIAVIVGAVASQVRQHEAALLGLSAIETALIGIAVGGALNRAVKA